MILLWDRVRRCIGSVLYACTLVGMAGWLVTANPVGVMAAEEDQGPAKPAVEAPAPPTSDSQSGGGLSWELPGRVSIYDLQFGAAVFKDNEWKFLGNARRFSASRFGKRLTLTIRFSYSGSRADIPLKFIVKLPDSRQYEETVHLSSRRGKYVYRFTVHRPTDFLGSGSIYLYYGFSIVDVLDFSILPGS